MLLVVPPIHPNCGPPPIHPEYLETMGVKENSIRKIKRAVRITFVGCFILTYLIIASSRIYKIGTTLHKDGFEATQ